MKTKSITEINDLYLRDIIRIVDNEGVFYILIGNYQVCQKTFNSRQEAITYVNNATSEIIINITLLTQQLNHQNNENGNR